MKKIKNLDSLSPLEKDVLNILWAKKAMKVREIYSILQKRRKVALCSVAVILDRLYVKNIVNRKIETARGGIRYIYSPKQDKDGFEKSIIETTVNKLIERFGSKAVSYFNERFQEKRR
ncbi:MAG: BlaI/MecI/CopY family transcriptional regulator [Nanoarchaeota archaeon]